MILRRLHCTTRTGLGSQDPSQFLAASEYQECLALSTFSIRSNRWGSRGAGLSANSCSNLVSAYAWSRSVNVVPAPNSMMIRPAAAASSMSGSAASKATEKGLPRRTSTWMPRHRRRSYP
jgi:hypothetical protein